MSIQQKIQTQCLNYILISKIDVKFDVLFVISFIQIEKALL